MPADQQDEDEERGDRGEVRGAEAAQAELDAFHQVTRAGPERQRGDQADLAGVAQHHGRLG